MKKALQLLIMSLAVVAVSSAGRAQDSGLPFRLQQINFDMWCQETQRLPPSRCDRRLPEDDAAFQAYVNRIENYEIENLRRHRQDRAIERQLRDNPTDQPQIPTVHSDPNG